MIMLCMCKHAYQDKLYGKYMRVKNPTKDGYRCTVCGVTIKADVAKREVK